MLLGKYYNTMDDQHRITVPKSLRVQLGANAVLTRGLDGALFLFPEDRWERFMGDMAAQPFTRKVTRDFLRLMSNAAQLVVPDSLGRITVAEDLTALAGLHKNIVVVGSLQYVEVWDRDRYHAYLDKLEPTAESLAESLMGEEHARSGHAD